MAICAEFVFEEDEETGLEGLKPLWLKRANATTSVAHDVLEHHIGPNEWSALEDELMAIGALLALRIENGVFNHYYSEEDQLANVVYSVIDDMAQYELEAPRKIATRRLAYEHAWTEDLIQAAVPKGVDMALNGLKLMESPFVIEHPDELKEGILGFLRKGYRATLARYKNADLYTVGYSLFKKVDKVSGALCKSGLLRFGDRVRFRVTPRTGEIQLKVNNVRLDVDDIFIN